MIHIETLLLQLYRIDGQVKVFTRRHGNLEIASGTRFTQW